MNLQGVISIYKEYKMYKLGTWYKNYSLSENGNLWLRRFKRASILIYRPLLLSNSNSRQRRIFKILQKEMEKFKDVTSKMTCGDCVHKNAYKLTNKCNKRYEKINI